MIANDCSVLFCCDWDDDDYVRKVPIVIFACAAAAAAPRTRHALVNLVELPPFSEMRLNKFHSNEPP